MIWITGFGPFLEVIDNPSARLARAVDGMRVGGVPVRGLVLPVSYGRAVPALTEAIRDDGRPPMLVLGTGVARGTRRARLERTAWSERTGRDVDGCEPAPQHRPQRRSARIDAPRLAEALDVDLSDDAGRYVCNAWLYDAVAAFPHAAVAFLHVPDDGLPPPQLLQGLARYLGAGAGAGDGDGAGAGARLAAF